MIRLVLTGRTFTVSGTHALDLHSHACIIDSHTLVVTTPACSRYGPTGAGKTFTMSGTPDDPGIMTRSISDLFRLMEEDAANVNYEVSVNYVEIYNETIRDLLVPGSPDLDLRETGDGNAVVCGVRWVDITTPSQLTKLLHEGNLRRTQEATLANQASSRSHSILEVSHGADRSLPALR